MNHNNVEWHSYYIIYSIQFQCLFSYSNLISKIWNSLSIFSSQRKSMAVSNSRKLRKQAKKNKWCFLSIRRYILESFLWPLRPAAVEKNEPQVTSVRLLLTKALCSSSDLLLFTLFGKRVHEIFKINSSEWTLETIYHKTSIIIFKLSNSRNF